MAGVFQPPPTWALPVIVDEHSGKSVFNPIWLRWFIDLSANLGPGGAGSGTVNAVTGTAPINSTGGNAPVLSMPAATALVDGYLSHIDWGTFNNKQPAGAYLTGNQTITLGGVLSGSGTTNIPAAFASTPWTGNGVNGTASGLYGTPSITVAAITASSINFGQTTLNGYKTGTFSPVATNLTVVGGVSYSAIYYTRIGNIVVVSFEVDAGTSSSSVAGSTAFTGLPYTPVQGGGISVLAQGTGSKIGFGNGTVDASSTVYPPSWTNVQYVTVSAIYITSDPF